MKPYMIWEGSSEDFTTKEVNKLLSLAQEYADEHSGCKKVSVGAVIVTNGTVPWLVFGANRAVPDLCKSTECRRIELYGEDSKNHRLPSDCRSIHSEIDAICNAAKLGISIEGATIFVTRYPCEACARAIISSGIKMVCYGREQQISKETTNMLMREGVNFCWYREFKRDDTER